MPVTLSIKNVPDALADALRERAALNHRSLQGELMATLEASVAAPKAGYPTGMSETSQALYHTPTQSLAERRKSARGMWKHLFTPEQHAFMTAPLPPEEQAALENAGLDEDWSVVPPPNTPPEGTNSK
jgi:antitoxin FitA